MQERVALGKEHERLRVVAAVVGQVVGQVPVPVLPSAFVRVASQLGIREEA
jgi:hypothetical protein